MFKQYFSYFNNQNDNILHFAAHSHHYWLDVSRDAVLDYWDTSAKLADEKWDIILSQIIPEAQSHIASFLDIDYPEQIAFAPNTQEFVFRLISCFDWFNKLKVLTTDSEFHSFNRQITRLEEAGKVTVRRVESFPFDSFISRFVDELDKEEYEIVFFSNVFFNSGFYINDISEIVKKAQAETMIVIDGYHSFMALPQSLREYQNRIFFLAGGYKYAMSGEGVCFMCLPKNNNYRPINTGWFATFGSLSENATGKIDYSDDAFKFWGSTFDPTGVYRFNSVCRFLKSINLDISAIHQYVINLQNIFLEGLQKINSKIFNYKNLLTPVKNSNRGHFLTFRMSEADSVNKKLRAKNVITDFRGDRLRIGFGIYQDEEDIQRLLKILDSL